MIQRAADFACGRIDLEAGRQAGRRIAQRQPDGRCEIRRRVDGDASRAVGRRVGCNGPDRNWRYVVHGPGERFADAGAFFVRRGDRDREHANRRRQRIDVADFWRMRIDRADDDAGVGIDAKARRQAGGLVGQLVVVGVEVGPDIRIGECGRDIECDRFAGVRGLWRRRGNNLRRLVGGDHGESVDRLAALAVVHRNDHGVNATRCQERRIVVERAGNDAGVRINRQPLGQAGGAVGEREANRVLEAPGRR